MAAVEKGEKEIVSLLLDKGGANVKTKTKLATPLMIAQEKGHLEIKQLLLDRGAQTDPGTFWKLRRSVLMRLQD